MYHTSVKCSSLTASLLYLLYTKVYHQFHSHQLGKRMEDALHIYSPDVRLTGTTSRSWAKKPLEFRDVLHLSSTSDFCPFMRLPPKRWQQFICVAYQNSSKTLHLALQNCLPKVASKTVSVDSSNKNCKEKVSRIRSCVNLRWPWFSWLRGRPVHENRSCYIATRFSSFNALWKLPNVSSTRPMQEILFDKRWHCIAAIKRLWQTVLQPYN